MIAQTDALDSRRLILFDIDETILSSDGAGRRAISRVLKVVHDDIPEEALKINMSGKTDPQIFSEILSIANKSYSDQQAILNVFLAPYLKALDEEIAGAGSYYMHQGVMDLLHALVAHDEAYLALLTGNVETGARMKLKPFDLNKYFPFGAFGSDSANRLDLPAIALERAKVHYDIDFSPQQVIVIGDSVNDILCAHNHGARCIAVNTGKTSREDLEKLQPAYLFSNLGNTDEVVKAIFS
jgi:phosphoglycolate phosphatase-like HAD superfamily hydrolase